MKKIIIDLNPAKPEEEAPAIQALNKYMPWVVVLLLLFILANAFAFAVVHVFEVSHKSLVKTLKNLTLQSKDVQTARDSMAALTKEKKEFDAIIAKDPSLAELMADTVSLIPDNLWFNNFVFSDGDMVIDGSVLQSDRDPMALLNKLIQDLTKAKSFSQRFKNIGLKNYRKTKKHGVETMEFRIECKK